MEFPYGNFNQSNTSLNSLGLLGRLQKNAYFFALLAKHPASVVRCSVIVKVSLPFNSLKQLALDLSIEVVRSVATIERVIKILKPSLMLEMAWRDVSVAMTMADSLYAMHRIRKAEYLADAVKSPVNFDLDEYIQAGGLQFGNGKKVRLSAWVSPWLAKILEETPLSADQKLTSAEG